MACQLLNLSSGVSEGRLERRFGFVGPGWLGTCLLSSGERWRHRGGEEVIS
jgi:hypothetical protein